MNVPDSNSRPAQTPRGILKPSSTSDAEISATLQKERERDVALHHANLLQQRKDLEFLILSSTETLLDLPSSRDSDPAHPLPQDATLVRNSLKPFQPADYDELIKERNINRQCGYVLCPRPNKLEDTKAKYRIIHGKGTGPDALRFVERENLEKWCSDECGRRALYIRVQLNEEPAWSRGDYTAGDSLILEDDKLTDAFVDRMKDLNLGDKQEDVVKKMKALAIERGDGKAPSRSFGMVDADVQETPIQSQSSVRSPGSHAIESMGAGSVEGFRPRQHEALWPKSFKGLDDRE